MDVESERDVGVGLRYAARVKLIVNDASKAAESAEVLHTASAES